MQKVKENRLKLTPTHFKILLTVKSLNEFNLYPTSKGVSNILKGRIDNETILYKDLPTYSTVISIPGRRFSAMINNLVRYNYLTYVYDKRSGGLYLKLTNASKILVDEYLKKHKLSLKKKISQQKREIVEIK